ENGPYSPAEFDVEMWVSNLSEFQVINPSIRIQNPITTFPEGTERLTVDPSTPQTYTFSLIPKQTQKLRWRLKVNEYSGDTLAMLRFLYKKDDDKEFVNFLDECTPLITIKGVFIPPADTVPPVVNRINN